MTTMVSRTRDEKYEQLVTQYVASLPGKLAALERAMSAGRAGDASALAEAREIAHRIHGTGGCYGLRELSEAAAVLDDVLTSMKRGLGGTWMEADSAASLVRAVAEAATRTH
jgi:HPt (histidine-containing phosphotransfer) domain-containing protein